MKSINLNISPDCYSFKQRILSKNILQEEIVVLPAGKRSAAGELNIHSESDQKTRLNDNRCDRDGRFTVGGMVKDFCDCIWNKMITVISYLQGNSRMLATSTDRTDYLITECQFNLKFQI